MTGDDVMAEAVGGNLGGGAFDSAPPSRLALTVQRVNGRSRDALGLKLMDRRRPAMVFL